MRFPSGEARGDGLPRLTTAGAVRSPPAGRPVRARTVLLQVAAALAVLTLAAWAVHNAADNLARRNIDFSFAFLAQPAGFDIPFRLTDWQTSDTYGRALLVSFVNTLLASGLCIVTASVLGLVVGLLRLSGNPLAALLARLFVELVRNTPQLLQIVFWYVAVLQVLPGPRQSIAIGQAAFLNVRGLFLPAPASAAFAWIVGVAVAMAILAPRLLARRAPRDGVSASPDPRLRFWGRTAACGIVVAGVGVACLATEWDLPALRGFNFAGGWRLPPELLALGLGISIYTSAFISENVRASILAVSGGQVEAARAIGLSTGQTLRLVILPQALRTLLPPLTSQYLNIIKSTTLGAAIAYPEVLQIFARTVLNQSGRALEVMILVLGVFLLLNLLVAALMNGWNRRLAFPGR